MGLTVITHYTYKLNVDDVISALMTNMRVKKAKCKRSSVGEAAAVLLMGALVGVYMYKVCTSDVMSVSLCKLPLSS
jgi:hypothetical protein